jgi:hypothetical protein
MATGSEVHAAVVAPARLRTVGEFLTTVFIGYFFACAI